MATTEYSDNAMLFNTSETLNAIVARYPEALKGLKAFGLDTCCGGALPLSVAARHHGLDANELATVLREQIEAEQ